MTNKNDPSPKTKNKKRAHAQRLSPSRLLESKPVRGLNINQFVAVRILEIQAKTGDVFRAVGWKEYKKYRLAASPDAKIKYQGSEYAARKRMAWRLGSAALAADTFPEWEVKNRARGTSNKKPPNEKAIQISIALYQEDYVRLKALTTVGRYASDSETVRVALKTLESGRC